jgi:hypothetical protein
MVAFFAGRCITNLASLNSVLPQPEQAPVFHSKPMRFVPHWHPANSMQDADERSEPHQKYLLSNDWQISGK